MRHNTNWNKKLENPNEYSSNWDWTKAHSEYHFDNSIKDEVGDWFEILGVFEGDWSSERDALIDFSIPINWSTRKFYGDIDAPSPMLLQEEYDIIQGGGNP